MIDLTTAQLQALDAPEQPPVAVDPRTGQHYLLIRREVYELVRGTLKPYDRGWDDAADDDLIRKDDTILGSQASGTAFREPRCRSTHL